MSKITIKSTTNPSIVKFELEETIIKGQNFEFKNIDETKNSPLAMQLFYLPFVKTVYISGNFIAIEKFSWPVALPAARFAPIKYTFLPKLVRLRINSAVMANKIKDQVIVGNPRNEPVPSHSAS